MKRSIKLPFLLILIGAVLILSNCGNPFNPNRVGRIQSRDATAQLTEAAQTPLINEFVFNHTGTDTNEYVEFIGESNTDYSALTILEIEGDSTSAGLVDGVFPVGTTDTDGYWTTGFLNNELENGTVTLLLVDGFSGSVGDDLDTDNDGLLDAAPWTTLVDSIAVTDGGSGDRTYGMVVLSPGFDGISFTAGGASRLPNGVDTDTASDWVRNDFDGEGIPGFSGTPDLGEALNTPGEENKPVTAAASPVINEFVFNHTGSDNHEFVELYGEPDTDYSAYAVLEIEGDSTSPGVVDGVFPVGTTDVDGYWTTGFLNNKLENGTVTLLLVQTFGGSQGDDLDVDDDGVLDITPWTAVVDSVAVNDGGVSDQTYSSVVLAAYFDGATYTPGGASRIPNGQDTDSVSDWVRNDFDGVGLPGFVGTPGDNEALNTPGTDNELAPPVAVEVTIMEIQGTGGSSPLNGELVKTRGVVTLESAYGGHFWIQDPEGDGDPATSDGIYVYRGENAGEVNVGDLIEITASVSEYAPSGSQPLTELVSASEITVEAQGQPLPTPVLLDALPDKSIPEGILFWEPLEGMLVSVEHARVVAATSAYGEFCMLANKNAKPGSGYQPVTKQILIRDTGLNQVDYNAERILVDDSSLEEPIIVSPGDWVKSLVGVVDYTFGNYKLQPSQFDVQTQWPPRGRVSRRSGAHGDFTITTFNVENLFDLVDNPAKDDGSSTPTASELDVKLSKLSLAIREELELPELLIVQEVENQTILQELGDRVNTAAGTDYTAVSFETSDVRGIEVGFLYDAYRVNIVDAYQMTGTDVDNAFGPSSASLGREPLVGVFDFNGTEITVIGNHFKSKGGDDPLVGINWPPVRSTEIQRKAQATVVRNFVNGILDADPEALVVVAGDLNDFQFGEPGEGTNHPLAILEGMSGEVPLTNVIHSIFEPLRFSYVYDGNSQVVDHILISPAVEALLIGSDILHINASFPTILSDDSSTALRCSDHDPVELRLWGPKGKKR